MADYPISNVARRIVYTGSAGVGPYAFNFEVLANTDLNVYKNDVLLALTTNYTVTISPTLGTGSITLVVAATGADRITIVGARAIQRTTDFTTGGDFFANTLNDEMDSQTILVQQVAETAERSIKAPVTDPTSINMVLPNNTTRANKFLSFNASGNPQTIDAIGTYRGNWATGTAYVLQDVVKDTSNNNIYVCITAHTSTGTQPISSNADVAKWALIVDAASATSSASAASSSASAASSSASAASTSASNASTSASNASTSASTATTQASNASASASAAAASYDSFDDRYLGAKASNPTLDNDGNALLTGALYFNSVSSEMRVYSGSSWAASYLPVTGLSASSGSSLVGHIASGTGAVARTVQSKLRESVSVKDFGAVGDGVTDDTASVLAAFTALNLAAGGNLYFPEGTYKLTSLLDLSAIPLSNSTIYGVKGKTTITGSFGYGLIFLGALTHVEFKDIIFETTYTNATLSSNTGVVYQGSVDTIESMFNGCKFTAPTANTQGLVFFNRTSAGGSETCKIDGLWIEDCEFDNIGAIGCTIMNRQTTSDKWLAARRVYFNRNKGNALGLSGNYGMLVSFDGYGSDFTCDNNSIRNAYLNGIENVSWKNGSISYNTFSTFTRKYRAIAVGNASYVTSGLTVIGNKCLEPATYPSAAFYVEDSYFAGNVWDFSDSLSLVAAAESMAFLFENSSRNTINGDTFRSDDAYAIRFKTSSANNRLRDCIITNETSASNTATVNFDSAGSTGNLVEGIITSGTGGSAYTQTTSATSNAVGFDGVGSWTPNVTFATAGDFAKTITASGIYTRSGRLCTVSFEIDSTSWTWTTASGALRITGLPFAADSVLLSYGTVGAFRGITKANFTQYSLRTNNGQTYLGIYASGSGQVTANLSAVDMPTGGTVLLYGQITYVCKPT